MKKLIIILANILLFLIFVSSCEHPDEQNGLIIKEIDILKISQLYLSEFVLTRETSKGVGTEYLFTNSINSTQVYIWFSICVDRMSANETGEYLLKDTSFAMREGEFKEVYVGDKFWWYAMYPELEYIAKLIFIRENVVFNLYCSDTYEELISLAKNMDDDILSKASYITFEN